MIGTLLKRVTVRTLDAVVERGRRSTRAPVRQVASVLDSVRGAVGLDEVGRAENIPAWTGDLPDQPMWDSDRRKLRKFQLDKGIIADEADDASAKAKAKEPEAPVVVYFKRGCPYTRAAMDLLRERDIPFVDNDITMDEATRGWLKIVTGHSTTPQIFIHGEAIGGYEELRALDQSGELARRLGSDEELGLDEAALEVTVADLGERLDDGQEVLVLDVRTDAEVRAGMLAHAVHIPLDQLGARASELDPEGVWIAYCKSGKRSMAAATQLRAQGFRSVVSLAGGIEAWRAAGREVTGYGDTAARRTPSRVRLPVVHPERSPFEGLSDDYAGDVAVELEGDELVARVREVIDECRPMVQADGGDIELLDVTADTVHVQLTGNCIGCPSSQATLKQGIERRLRSRIPQIKQIQSPQL